MKLASLNTLVIGLAVGSMLAACAPKSRFKPGNIDVQTNSTPVPTINILGINTPNPTGRNPYTTVQQELAKKVEDASVTAQKIKVEEKEVQKISVKIKLSDKEDAIVLAGVQEDVSEDENLDGKSTIKLKAVSGIKDEDIASAKAVCKDENCIVIETDIVLKNENLVNQPRYGLQTTRLDKSINLDAVKGYSELVEGSRGFAKYHLGKLAAVIVNETKVTHNEGVFLTYQLLDKYGAIPFVLSGNAKDPVQDLKIDYAATVNGVNVLAAAKLNVTGENLEHALQLFITDSDDKVKTLEINLGSFATKYMTSTIPSTNPINTTTLQ